MTAPSSDDDDLLAVRMLAAKLEQDRRGLEMLDRYYDGEQATSFLSEETRAMTGDRLTEVIAGFPALVVDRREHRLDVEGFRLAGEGTPADDIWDEWQRLNLDESSGEVHVDAMLYGRTFVSVWTDDDDQPLVAAESPLQVTVDRDPATRRVRKALKRWQDVDATYANLYLPERLVKYSAPRTAAAGTRNWTKVDQLDNPLGAVPIVPFVHRPRTRRPDGYSVLHHVLPLVDIINKLATDLMVTSEFHAEPRRFATGMQIASDPAQRERFREEVKQYWDMLTQGRTMVGGTGVTIGQLPAANLDNFTSALSMFVSWLAAMAALPLTSVGIHTDNPASAEALRAAQDDLVMDSRRIARSLSGPWEHVIRLDVATQRGIKVEDLPAEFTRMETVWRNPETASVGQEADAALKLTQGDRPIIDVEQAQEDLGYSPEQRRQMAERRNREQLGPVAAQIAEAKRLQAEEGLTQPEAFAAVGLLESARLQTART